MELARIKVSGVRATPYLLKEIPRGITGATVRFEYADPMWDGLSKTVVFRGSGVTKDVVDAGDEVEVPKEVVARAGQPLLVGVYGTSSDIPGVPTLWANLGEIRGAADPSGDESTDPALPVWAQLQKQIDEIRENGTGSVDEAVVQEMVEDYLQENPPEPGKDGKDGLTPYIGENGNWYVGDTDTGSPSKGDPGEQGSAGESGVYILSDGETIEDAPEDADVVIDPNGEADLEFPETLPNPFTLTFTGAVEATYDGSKAVTVTIPEAVTDEHINELINTALTAMPNAAEVAY